MIFDVIESANDKSVIDLFVSISGKGPQEIFDNHLLGKASVKLRVNRSISLPSLTNTLTSGMTDTSFYEYLSLSDHILAACKEKVDFTHVIALKYAPSDGSVDDCYGLTLGTIIFLETVSAVIVMQFLLLDTV